MNHLERVMIEFEECMKDFPKGILLDVGARYGEMRPFFENNGWTYVGCDVFPQGEGVYFANMHGMPFKNECFDVIFCCHTFEDSHSPVIALREFMRVLKKGGIMFIATPFPCYHQVLGADEDHINVVSAMQVERLFRYCGVKKVTIYENRKQPLEQDWDIIAIGGRE